ARATELPCCERTAWPTLAGTPNLLGLIPRDVWARQNTVNCGRKRTTCQFSFKKLESLQQDLRISGRIGCKTLLRWCEAFHHDLCGSHGDVAQHPTIVAQIIEFFRTDFDAKSALNSARGADSNGQHACK